MRITHLNTYTEGGAALAALRIHLGLIHNEEKSEFIALYKANCKLPGVNDFRDNLSLPQKLRLKLLNKLYTSTNKKKYREAGELFGELKSVWNVNTHPLVQQSHIIHLHWIDHFVHLPNLFRSCQSRIVWTLHDHFPFSGGFHYPPAKMKDEWKKQSEKQKEILRELFSKRSIDLVFPSKNLHNMAQASGIFTGSRLHVIKNPIDTELFKPMDKADLRKKHGLPQDKKILFYISDHIHYPRKGYQYFEQALALINRHSAVLVVGKGELPEMIHGITVYNKGHVNNESHLAELYNCADLLVNPSLEDISSNTVIEAMACGTPSVAFSSGGIPELIDETNGIIASEKTPQALSKAIDVALQQVNDREKIHEKAKAEHSLDIIAKKYAAVYYNS